MNRLTFKTESGFYGVVGLKDYNKDQQLRMCIKKLLDYEETNFTPEDMVNLKDFMEEEKFLNVEDLKLFVKFSKNNSYNVIPILEYFREEMISKNTEISNLKQQLAEKDKEIKELQYNFDVAKNELTRLKKNWNNSRIQQRRIYNNLKENQNQDKIEFAIDKLSDVNEILTDTIIEVTEDDFDLNRTYYLEEISAKFGEKINQRIKQLEVQKNV